MTATLVNTRWRHKHATQHALRNALCRFAPMAVLPGAAALFALSALPGVPGIPGAAIGAGSALPRWAWMWLLAWCVWFGCKWATWWPWRSVRAGAGVHAAYLLCWPGMDAHAVLASPRDASLAPGSAWVRAFAVIHLGAGLLWGIVPYVYPSHPVVAGWCVMIAVVLMLHFGLFALLMCYWREHGFAVEPMMDRPARSRSCSEFWGIRWNRDFHRLAMEFVFTPMRRHISARSALLVTFIVSGLVHDLVISVPAGGGYGGPTAYFALQAVGILIDRRLRGAHGMLRKVWMWCVLIAPLPLLFHTAFIEHIVLPFASAIGACN